MEKNGENSRWKPRVVELRMMKKPRINKIRRRRPTLGCRVN
jgi:hypothetical protein